MNSLGDCALPVRAMIDRVHRCDDSGKNRRRANVARRSVATDVLLTRLERESIGGPTFLIVRNANQSTGHVKVVLVAGWTGRGVRFAKAERKRETARGTQPDIS